MKIKSFFFATFSLLMLDACQTDNRPKENENQEVNTQQESPVKLIEYLVGEWEMEDASDDSGTGNEEANPGEKLTFTSEARYVVHEGEQRVDSGAYRMNEQLRNLYLESADGEDTREYEIDLEHNRMTLKPDEGDGSYVYHRTSPASVPAGTSNNDDKRTE